MRRKVLGIVGSYRKGGTIDQAVSTVLAAAAAGGAATEKVYLLDSRIEFCTNCRNCTQHPGPDPGRCFLEDDMAGLIERVERADALVLGAPVNFGNVNALTQRVKGDVGNLCNFPFLLAQQVTKVTSVPWGL
jgi:multimeric flavodoxin WrbA